MSTEELTLQICADLLGEEPSKIERCAVGHGNYVYLAELSADKYIVRLTEEQGAYDETVRLLEKAYAAGIPVPRVVSDGQRDGYEFLILTYIEGRDLGLVYDSLTMEDKRAIAKEVVRIQELAADIGCTVDDGWTWRTEVDDLLDRSEERITANGYFDPERVQQLRAAAEELSDYFDSIPPVAYLDDITTKNLIIDGRRVSGIVDLDWIGVGDKLTYIAMTEVALLNMGCDADYPRYILDEMCLDEVRHKAYIFYKLIFCVDFMGERGMQFGDKRVDVSPQVVDRLNEIYDRLWSEWKNM